MKTATIMIDGHLYRLLPISVCDEDFDDHPIAMVDAERQRQWREEGAQNEQEARTISKGMPWPKPSIEAIVQQAAEKYRALSPEEKAKHDQFHRESWARGEASISAAERAEGRNTTLMPPRRRPRGKRGAVTLPPKGDPRRMDKIFSALRDWVIETDRPQGKFESEHLWDVAHAHFFGE